MTQRHEHDDMNGPGCLQNICRYNNEMDTTMVNGLRAIETAIETQTTKLIDVATGRDMIPIASHRLILITAAAIFVAAAGLGFGIAYLKTLAGI